MRIYSLLKSGSLYILVGLLLVLACSSPACCQVVRVFAAASLTEAFTEIGEKFEELHPGITVEFNFAGSQILRTQIEQGAEVDVFASADRIHADALKDKDLLGETSIFAHNELVVVTPMSDTRVRSLVDLARPRTKIVVAGSTVPVGRYTTQALRLMTASSLYGDDFQSRVQANVVSQESNVRAVLAKVSLGEADAGFVYKTDAQTALSKVRVLSVPDQHNVIAEYPIGVLANSPSKDLANEFLSMVTGAQGQAILQKFGFMK